MGRSLVRSNERLGFTQAWKHRFEPGLPVLCGDPGQDTEKLSAGQGAVFFRVSPVSLISPIPPDPRSPDPPGLPISLNPQGTAVLPV
ncbi:hypothetical protein GCM10009603_57920 [Nocardiopsis exhalans]